MKILADLTGNTYGRLIVLSFHHMDEDGTRFWLCQCECGNTKVIRHSSLTTGCTKSCGCLKNELREKYKKNSFKKKAYEESFIKNKILMSKHSMYYL